MAVLLFIVFLSWFIDPFAVCLVQFFQDHWAGRQRFQQPVNNIDHADGTQHSEQRVECDVFRRAILKLAYRKHADAAEFKINDNIFL